MNPRSRFFFVSMSAAFILSGTGLVLGMFYDLYVVFIRHHTLEAVLSRTIPYYKTVGGLGILGMVCFFLFLVSQITAKKDKRPRE